MNLEVVRFTIDPLREAEFLSAHLQARRLLAADPHCLGFSLRRCTEQPEAFMFMVEWDSLEGHELGFRRTPAFETFKALVRPFFRTMEINHYDQVIFETRPGSDGEGVRHG